MTPKPLTFHQRAALKALGPDWADQKVLTRDASIGATSLKQLATMGAATRRTQHFAPTLWKLTQRGQDMRRELLGASHAV